jgi:hypothetical protein
MKQELRIQHTDIGELVYKPFISGQIELLKLTEKLSILKLFFQKLRIIDKSENMHFDYTTEVMLSNFPIDISSLNELDGVKLFIDEGFGDETFTTMLSINDGEPINNSKITFKLVKENCFCVEWTGSWGAGNYDNENFRLDMVVYQEENITTPLCEWNKDLIERFTTK